MELPIYTFPRLAKEFKEFFTNYTDENILACPYEEIKNLKLKQERICRFCGLDNSMTKFDKKAHIIPHLLGNEHLVSDFECDNCNNIFSEYETNLANFLGISRTVFGVMSKNGIPNFESNRSIISAKRVNFYNLKDVTKITLSNPKKYKFNINDHEGKTEIKYIKPSFTPIKVYTALLKIALSMIPEEYIEGYKYAFKFLLDIKKFKEMAELAKVNLYQVPNNHRINRPYCILFTDVTQGQLVA